MKLYTKRAIILLLGVALSYSACKKDVKSTPVAQTQTASTDVVSTQVATNLAQSLSGAYGGVNLNSGISSPSLATNSSSRAVNSLSSTATCGFFDDNGIDVKTNIGDTIKSETTGAIDFSFKCDTHGNHNGFINDDSLLTIGKAPGYAFTFDLTQHYNVSILADANHLEVDGNIKSFIDFIYTKKGTSPTSVHNKFVLSGLEIDLTKGADITGGTATFTSEGTYGGATWDLTGLVKFIGNHEATITINGKTVTVNLLTGQIIP
jgi:hypothetical protein